MSYTSSKAQTSQGTLLQVDNAIGSGSPLSLVPVYECKNLTFSNKNMFDDVTNLQSTAKEFLAVLQDPGKLTFDLNRVDNDPGQAVLQNLFAIQPPPKVLFTVTFPINTAAGQSSAGTQWQFLAYVESISPDVKVDKAIQAKGVLQITNGITVIEGS